MRNKFVVRLPKRVYFRQKHHGKTEKEMYYYIKGRLAKKSDNSVVIDNGGIGYRIYTSANSLSGAGEAGSEIKMYTHLNVREDVFDLYGFITEEERDMFLNLLSVSGVGPKAALAVLSAAAPAKLALAVITGDAKTITKAQGVGPKMAQRIILELKDKLKNEDLDILPDDSPETDTKDSGASADAVSALVVLGYSAADASRAVSEAGTSGNTEEIIKRALVQLMK